MKDNQPFHNSRLKQREKRRKTNLILNSLIGIVLVLIVLVSIQIFFTDDQATNLAGEQSEQVTTEEKADSVYETDSPSEEEAQQDEQDRAVEVEKEHEKKSEDKKTKDNDESITDEQDGNKEKNAADIEEEAIVTEGGDDPNVTRTIVNPGWEPIGTVQTGEHYNVYSGIDWDEMVQAISYATGIDESNMTIYHLGNNGPNKSVGTIQAKDTKQKYRVYIEWVDEKGWKPTLVQELAE